MKHIQLTKNDAKKRLDGVLAERLCVSRSRAKQLLDAGYVQAMDRVLSAAYKIKGDELLCIDEPAIHKSELKAEAIALDVVYEDADIIVVNKAAGLVVHPGAGNWSGTLVHALLHHFPDITIGHHERPGIVHRLDKETSGLMVIARHDEALQRLTQAFKERSVKKVYRAFCVGRFEKDDFELITGHARHGTNRKRFTTKLLPPMQDIGSVGSRKIRLAHSRFHVLVSKEGLSELEVELLTGRTHQIRAHLADISRPLVADVLYGGDKALKRLKESEVKEAAMALSRHALHAAKLEFAHPMTQKLMTFEAQLPEDLMYLHEVLVGEEGLC